MEPAAARWEDWRVALSNQSIKKKTVIANVHGVAWKTDSGKVVR